MAKTIQDKMNERFKVKVYKPAPNSDDRTRLEGEKLQKEIVGDEERHFFVISAHRADYINRMFRQYTVSDPFIPGVDDEALLGNMEKPNVEEEDGKK